MPTISTEIDIIKSGNPDFNAIQITETTYLSPLNNHKFEYIYSD